MKKTLTKHLWSAFAGTLLMLSACQAEDTFPINNESNAGASENPYAMTPEASIQEVNTLMSQLTVKEGGTISLRAASLESMECTVETSNFSVALENSATTSRPSTQKVPVHTIRYKNSQGEQAGFALTIADERFPQKVIAFNEEGTIDLNAGPNAEFWQDRINGYIYNVVNNPELQTGAKSNTNTPVNLRTGGMNAYYHHVLTFHYNWHQLGAPYTDYTPFRNGQRASTGCVSVAMGMIMAWHQWPIQGAYPRYEKDASGRITLKNEVIFYNPYTWSLFHPTDFRNRVSSTDPRVREHIANLLAEIGYKLNANFVSNTETYAYAGNISGVFRQMGYTCAISPTYFDSNQILNAIDNNRPVLVEGFRLQTSKEKEDNKTPSHLFIISGVITQGSSNNYGGHSDLMKPLFVYIMNGTAGSGDGWFHEEIFSDNKLNLSLDPDGRDENSYLTYKYRFKVLIQTDIKPDSRNNKGSTAIWRISDQLRYGDYYTIFEY